MIKVMPAMSTLPKTVITTTKKVAKPTLEKALPAVSALGVIAGSSMSPGNPIRDIPHVPGTSVMDPLPEQIGYFSDRLIDLGGEGCHAALHGTQKVLNVTIDGVQGFVGGVVDGTQRVVNGAIDSAQKFMGGNDVPQTIVGKAIDGTQDLVNGLIDGTQDLICGTVDVAQDVLDGAFDIAGDAVDVTTGALHELVDVVVDVLT